jgi:hypothetical protein
VTHSRKDYLRTNRHPRPQIIEYLTTVLDNGFDPGWTLYHRGRLNFELGDRAG